MLSHYISIRFVASCEAIFKVVICNPDPLYISTSYIERSESHASHDEPQIHAPYECTPCMAASITDHVWTIEELFAI